MCKILLPIFTFLCFSQSLAFAETIIRHLEFSTDQNLSGVITKGILEDVGGTVVAIRIQISNSSPSTYECEGAIQFRRSQTGNLDGSSTVSGSSTVGPFSSNILVVQATNLVFGSSVYHNPTGLDDLVSCTEIRSSGTNGNSSSGNSPTNNDLDLQCPCSVELIDSKVRFSVDQISNNRTGGTSGSLKLQVWATETPYTGGDISGYKLADYSLSDVLEAGEYFTSIDRSIFYTIPPDGEYHLSIILTEYNNGGDYIVDHATLAPSFNFNSAGNASSDSDEVDNPNNSPNNSARAVFLECPCTFNIDSPYLNIFASKISNNRSNGNSGTLKLKLWATNTPYPGNGPINGYTLGEYRFSKVLNSGQYFSDVDRTILYTPPPEGSYYVTLALTEHRDGDDYIIDSAGFNGVHYLGDSNKFTGPGLDFENGGGASGPIFFLGLFIMIILKIQRRGTICVSIGESNEN